MTVKARCKHCKGTLWRNGGDWQCASCGRPEVQPHPAEGVTYNNGGSHRTDRKPSYKRTTWERT